MTSTAPTYGRTRATSAQPRALSHADFMRIREYLYEEAGIHLSEAKKALVAARLSKRLAALGLPGYGAYFHYLVSERDGLEQIHFLDALCTNETSFFREPRQFEWLRRQMLPQWKTEADQGRRSRDTRIWSAACSSGEEPYSIAMSLLDGLPVEDGWNHRVLATDLSTKVLERAQQAVWPVGRAETIHPSLRKRYMLRGVRSRDGLLKAAPELRAVVEFRRLNLYRDLASVEGRFDMIFCRNVLIYFNTASRKQVLEGLTVKLKPGGYLLLGHAESLNGMGLPYRSVFPTVYQRNH